MTTQQKTYTEAEVAQIVEAQITKREAEMRIEAHDDAKNSYSIASFESEKRSKMHIDLDSDCALAFLESAKNKTVFAKTFIAQIDDETKTILLNRSVRIVLKKLMNSAIRAQK